MLPSQVKVYVSSCKRKRGPNWSEKEKNVLVDEYKKRRHILRPRGMGLTTVVERETAWDEICTALKVVSGPYVKRDVVDMRKKWDNLCFWAKKCIAEWKDKNSGGGTKLLNSEYTPPALALKILAIYQEEWAELFPNAQVVDGGDVFFVLNNDNHHPAKANQEDNGDSKEVDDEDNDVYQVIDSELDTNPPSVKEEVESVDNRWQQDIVPEDENFQDYSAETSGGQSSNQVSTSLAHSHSKHPQMSTPSPPPQNDSLPPSSSTLGSAPVAHGNGFQFTQIPSDLSQNSDMKPVVCLPPHKRKRYSHVVAEDNVHSDSDDEKDIETLSRDLLILRKEKLILEKQKLEIEKEKLVIERDILDMQRERQWLQLENDRLANGQT